MKQYSGVQELKVDLNKTWKELDEESLKPFLDLLKNISVVNFLYTYIQINNVILIYITYT